MVSVQKGQLRTSFGRTGGFNRHKVTKEILGLDMSKTLDTIHGDCLLIVLKSFLEERHVRLIRYMYLLACTSLSVRIGDYVSEPFSLSTALGDFLSLVIIIIERFGIFG